VGENGRRSAASQGQRATSWRQAESEELSPDALVRRRFLRCRGSRRPRRGDAPKGAHPGVRPTGAPSCKPLISTPLGDFAQLPKSARKDLLFTPKIC